MTEQEFFAAVDMAVARWHQDRQGEPLTCLPFDRAVPAHCHDNAEAYVAAHGGEVVHGFLVEHPHAWTMVWVMPHSVVRTADGLVDVTLNSEQLRLLSFFWVVGDSDGFQPLAMRFPRESRPIASALCSRLERDGIV